MPFPSTRRLTLPSKFETCQLLVLFTHLANPVLDCRGPAYSPGHTSLLCAAWGPWGEDLKVLQEIGQPAAPPHPQFHSSPTHISKPTVTSHEFTPLCVSTLINQPLSLASGVTEALAQGWASDFELVVKRGFPVRGDRPSFLDSRSESVE